MRYLGKAFSVCVFVLWAASVVGFITYALRHGESLSSAHREPAIPIRELR